jgi:hypothetical protein
MLCVLAAIETFANAAQVDDDTCEVKGRLVVIDATGAEQTEESGTAYVSLLSDSTALGFPTEMWQPRRIFLIEGHFAFKIRKGMQVRFDLLQLDHGQARSIPDSTNDSGPLTVESKTFRDPCDAELVVRARYLPPVRVHLVDADDHSELSGIDVIREPRLKSDDDLVYASPHSNSLSAYPPPFSSGDIRLRASSSPLTLQVDSDGLVPFFHWRERLWCHAPGHCWTPLDVDYLIGGESTLKLARSGSMRVRVDGSVPAVGARLVLKPSEDSGPADGFASRSSSDRIVDESEPSLLDWWPVSAEKESRFDGLPPGKYRLELQAGIGLGRRNLLGSVGVAIERGKETNVELATSPVPTTRRSSRIPFAIELRLDPMWTDEPFEITLDPRDDPSLSDADEVRISRPGLLPKGDARDLWTTAGLALTPGTWWLRIDRFRIQRQVKVDAKARTLEVDVGPPVDVAFHFVDSRSHEPVFLRKHCWYVPARDAAGERLFGNWPLTPKNHTLRARVPAGPIEITGENEEYDLSEPIIANVGTIDRDVQIPLKRLTGIRVSFTLDGESLPWNRVFRGKPPDQFKAASLFDLPWPDETAMSVVPDGSTSSATNEAKLYDFSGKSTCFRLSRPGTFNVTFRDSDRFEPIAPREVLIPDERVVEVVIPLQRKE